MNIYVKQNGSDTFVGTSDQPMRTVEGAISRARDLKAAGTDESLTVLIGAGEYKTAGIALDARDSSLTLAALGDGEVTLCGSMTLSSDDFRPLTEAQRQRIRPEARDRVLSADLRAMGLNEKDWGRMCSSGTYSTGGMYDDAVTSPMWCELFFDGRRMEVARYPDEGFLHSVSYIGKAAPRPEYDGRRNPPGELLKIDPDTAKRVSSWATTEDVWVFGYPMYGWADASSPVERIDTDECVLETRYYSSYGVRETAAPYYFYNVIEELDSPGEWYLDREGGILYLYPPSDIASAKIELTLHTGELLRIGGADNVTVRGITFSGTRGDAVTASGSGIKIESCTVRNIGGWAITVNGAGCAVTGCEISHTGRGGVRMSGGDRSTLTPSGNEAVNNHIHHIAEIYRTYHPAVQMSGVGGLCAHNCIHDSAHMAIGFSGNGHVIEYNEIYSVCLIADDSGAIYSGRDYTTCGNTIRNNFFHDMASDAKNHIGIFGVYCDDNLGATTITGNVFLRCQSALLLHGGHDMVFENNLIIDARPKSEYSLRFHKYFYWNSLAEGGAHRQNLAAVPWQGEIWSAAYPRIAEYLTWDPETEQCIPHGCSLRRNIIIAHKPIDIKAFDASDERYGDDVSDNLELATRAEAGIPEGDELCLDGVDLSALLPGFERIELEKMGLVK